MLSISRNIDHLRSQREPSIKRKEKIVKSSFATVLDKVYIDGKKQPDYHFKEDADPKEPKVLNQYTTDDSSEVKCEADKINKGLNFDKSI